MMNKTYFVSATRRHFGVDRHIRPILEMTDLPDGWHYGSGKAPDCLTAALAVRIAMSFLDHRADKLECFPDPEGAILIAGYFAENSIEALCRPNGQISIFVENGEGEEEVFEVEDFDRASGIINGRLQEWRTSLGLSTKGTGAQKSKDLLDWPFKTPPITEAFRLSTETVSKELTVSARTFARTTPREFPEIRRSTWRSKSVTCHAA